MVGPPLHVLVKILDVRIFHFRLTENFPAKSLLEQFRESCFTNSDVAGDGDVI